MNLPLFHFHIECSDEELPHLLQLPEEEYAAVFTRGDYNWCLQTFLHLSKRGNLNVSCSNKLVEGAINMVHSDQLLKIKGTERHFVVCVRADYPQRIWAHHHLVQNKNQLSANCSFIPHWVQPGLVARDPSRNGVKKVAYSGQTFNGNLAGNAESWKSLFEPHRIEFTTLTAGSWHHLENVDVLIALRSFDKKPHDTKPPSKLFSAWHAGIPFIGGYDSAFQQVGKPGEDFLLAETPEDVVKAVLLLANNPDLYQKLVKNGREKARLYNTETIAETWEQVLTGPVLKRFTHWLKNPQYEMFRYKNLLKAGVLQHESKQVIKKILGIKR